jgi:hypothetical protein
MPTQIRVKAKIINSTRIPIKLGAIELDSIKVLANEKAGSRMKEITIEVKRAILLFKSIVFILNFYCVLIRLY